MYYQGFMPNDFINGEGVCVSLWVSGCPFHCKGCHNKEAWDFNSGSEVPTNIFEKLDNAITANNIKRNFSILGGEPLCEENRDFVLEVVKHIRKTFPDIKIFLWTGYTFQELEKMNDLTISDILSYVNVLIDGRYEDDKRDVSLPLRGSSNQKIYQL